MVDRSCKVLTISDPDAINNDAGVTSVSISPDGRFVAAGSPDTVVRIWDVATGEQLKQMDGHTQGVTSVAFSLDGSKVVSGSWDKSVCIWDAGIGGQQKMNGLLNQAPTHY